MQKLHWIETKIATGSFDELQSEIGLECIDVHIEMKREFAGA